MQVQEATVPEKKWPRKTLLVDTTKCTGCRSCQLACKEWHNREAEESGFENTYESPLDLTYNTWLRVVMREAKVDGQTRWLFRPDMCKHCWYAACERVCPVPGCITKDPASGFAVVLDERLCIGCLYCVYTCPFSVPRYEPKKRIVSKCTRCFDRSDVFMRTDKAGPYKTHVPYCVAACPTGALQFGLYSDMRKIADTRINMLKTKHGKSGTNPYGYDYLGGLGVIYILESPHDEDYALPRYPRMPAAVRTWQGLWKPLSFIMAGATILFWLLHYAIIGPAGVRMIEDEEEEERELTEEEYERMINAKRRAGKSMRDMPKGYRPRKHKKGAKGRPPRKRSKLPRKGSDEEE